MSVNISVFNVTNLEIEKRIFNQGEPHAYYSIRLNFTSEGKEQCIYIYPADSLGFEGQEEIANRFVHDGEIEKLKTGEETL